MVHPDILSDLHTSIPIYFGKQRSTSKEKFPPKQGQQKWSETCWKIHSFHGAQKGAAGSVDNPPWYSPRVRDFRSLNRILKVPTCEQLHKTSVVVFLKILVAKTSLIVNTIRRPCFLIFRLSWHLLGGYLISSTVIWRSCLLPKPGTFSNLGGFSRSSISQTKRVHISYWWWFQNLHNLVEE